jgi:DNA-binding transcriptional regulator YiaG
VTRADESAPIGELATNHRIGPSRPWKLYDRLTPDDIKRIVHDYGLGTTQKNLAIRFNVSVSSVQRVLRDHCDER